MSTTIASTAPITNDALGDLFAELGLGDIEVAAAPITNEPEVLVDTDPVEIAALPAEEPAAEVAAEPSKPAEIPVIVVEKGKKPRKPKAEKPAAEDKPKRVFFGRNKLGRLEAGLGGKLNDYLLLTMREAALEGEELTARVAENTAMFKGLGVKVQNRATNLIEYAAGKTTSLTPVSVIALDILAKDGQITVGDKGNFLSALMTQYSTAAARAMGNNTLNMLRNLQLVSLGAKGVLVPNSDSLLLAVVAAKRNLDFGTDEGAGEPAEPIPGSNEGEGSDLDIKVDASGATVVIEPQPPIPVAVAHTDLVDNEVDRLLAMGMEEAPM